MYDVFFDAVVVIRVHFSLSREGERREHKGDALYLSYLPKTFFNPNFNVLFGGGGRTYS